MRKIEIWTLAMNQEIENSDGSKDPSINFKTGVIWNADNIDVMRGMNSESVDLIYLDPPFNSGRNYYGTRNAKDQKFLDNWSEEQLKEWNRWEGIQNDVDLLRDQKWWTMIELVKEKHSKSMYYYLSFIAVRLLQMKRILKSTGSLYLHCDDTSNSYLKILLDCIFGPKFGPGVGNHGVQITWKRTSSSNRARRRYGRIADTIYVYRKSEKYTHNPQLIDAEQDFVDGSIEFNDHDGRGSYEQYSLAASDIGYKYDYKGYSTPVQGWRFPLEKMRELDKDGRISFPETKEGKIQLKRYLTASRGVPNSCFWIDIKMVNSQAKERTGWETQKPIALLNRIINTSSNPGDIVFDPFCGCGTTLFAALERPVNENRHVIGCEIDSEVCHVINRRVSELNDRKMQDLFQNVEIEVLDCLNDRSLLPVRTDQADIDEQVPKLGRIDVRKIYGTVLYGEQKGYCPCCGRHIKFDFMDVIHRIPIDRGGTNDRENLQLFCRKCSSTSKGRRTIEERQGEIL